MNDEPIRYWSRGPHYMYPDSIIFLTWRLAETLPKHVMNLFEELKQDPDTLESKWEKHQLERDVYLFSKFEEYDKGLAEFRSLDFSLNDAKISKTLRDIFHYYDVKLYELHAYCIMHNHIHMIIRPLKGESGEYIKLGTIMKSLKSLSAHKINKILNQSGTFWNRHYFDRVIRDLDGYAKVMHYIRMNPVAAGLVENPEDWRDTYVNESYYEYL